MSEKSIISNGFRIWLLFWTELCNFWGLFCNLISNCVSTLRVGRCGIGLKLNQKVTFLLSWCIRHHFRHHLFLQFCFNTNTRWGSQSYVINWKYLWEISFGDSIGSLCGGNINWRTAGGNFYRDLFLERRSFLIYVSYHLRPCHFRLATVYSKYLAEMSNIYSKYIFIKNFNRNPYLPHMVTLSSLSNPSD